MTVDITEIINTHNSTYSGKISTPDVAVPEVEIFNGVFQNQYGRYEYKYLEADTETITLNEENSPLVRYQNCFGGCNCNQAAGTYEIKSLGAKESPFPQYRKMTHLMESGWYLICPEYYLEDTHIFDLTPKFAEFQNLEFTSAHCSVAHQRLYANCYDYLIVAKLGTLSQEIEINPPILTQAYGATGFFYNLHLYRHGYDSRIKIDVAQNSEVGWECLYDSYNIDDLQLYIPAIVGLTYVVTLWFGINTNVYTWTCQNPPSQYLICDDCLGIYPELKPNAFIGYFGICPPKYGYMLKSRDAAGDYLNIETPNTVISIEGVSVSLNTVTETKVARPIISIAGVTVDIDTVEVTR